MIVTFSGLPGSGKSGIAKRLAAELKWPFYDIGVLRRQKAAERGMTLEEYNEVGKTDPSTDLEVDEYQAKLGRERDNFIIGGRTSWHFIPHSLKIFLSVRPEVGAARILNDVAERNEAKGLNSLADVIESVKKRLVVDNFRYQKYFSIDVYDLKNYDWVFDTSDLNQEEVYEQVKAYVVGKIGSAQA